MATHFHHGTGTNDQRLITQTHRPAWHRPEAYRHDPIEMLRANARERASATLFNSRSLRAAFVRSAGRPEARSSATIHPLAMWAGLALLVVAIAVTL